MNTVAEMGEDCLNVFKNPNMIVSTSVAFIVLQFIDDLENFRCFYQLNFNRKHANSPDYLTRH